MEGKIKVVSFRPQTALARGSSAQSLALQNKSSERQVINKIPRSQSNLLQKKTLKNLINYEPKELQLSKETHQDNETMVPVPQRQNKSTEKNKFSYHLGQDSNQEQLVTQKQANQFAYSLQDDLPQFKILQPLPEKSQYQTKYIRHPHGHQLNTVNNFILDTYKDDLKMSLTTTNRIEFKSVDAYPQSQTTKPRPQTSKAPFSSATSYQTTFFKKDGQQLGIISQNHPTVMKDLEFLGETVYKNTFKGETLTKEPFYNFGARSSFKNPMTIDLPFFSKSSSNFMFKPYKVKHLTKSKINETVMKTPSFFGQYDTQYRQDFTANGIVQDGISVQSTQKLFNDRKECQNANKRILPIF